MNFPGLAIGGLFFFVVAEVVAGEGELVIGFEGTFAALFVYAVGEVEGVV